MENYREVMLRAVELSETVEEAILHVQKLIKEGNFEQATFMFEDAMKGCAQLEFSIEEKLLANSNQLFLLITENAHLTIDAFSFQRFQEASEIIGNKLLKAVILLQNNMKESWNDYLVH